MNTDGIKTCVILQPGYLPWLGFFEQMHRADDFVFLDDVQYDKHSWRNRNRIKGPDGPQWLTVPVLVSGQGKPAIRDVQIDPTQPRWAEKHLHAIHQYYHACLHFNWLFPELEAILNQPRTSIADLDIDLIKMLCEKLGLQRRLHRSSDLNVPPGRCERLIEICRRLDARHYYSGAAAKSYIDPALFSQAGIKVEFQDYKHPEYPQRYGDFVSHLSVIDLMFNCGPESLTILTGSRA